MIHYSTKIRPVLSALPAATVLLTGVLMSVLIGGARVAAQTVHVTLTEGTNMAAAVSPDGEWLALDLVGRIWILPIDGGRARPLIDELWDARQPTWSPDGRDIAFQAYRDGNWHIWRVSVDGGVPGQLTSGPQDDREPHWSPDGRRIAFSSDREGTYDIWALDVASGAVERLTDGEGNEWGPAFGPRGARIAFATREGVMIREAGGLLRRVTRAVGLPQAPAWSPDGRTLTFVDLGRANADLSLVSVDGSDSVPEVISRSGGDVFPFRATYTPTGDRVYTADGMILRSRAGAVATRPIPFQATVELDRPTYPRARRDFDGTEPQPVKGIKSPRVAPDGSRVVFAAVGDLWMREADGSVTRLTDDVYLDTDPAWSPEGDRIAFSSDRAGTMDIWIRDLATGEEWAATHGERAELSAAWSADGTEIAYVTRGGIGDGGFVEVVDLETSQVRTLTGALFNPSHPSWSPDGRRLAVAVLEPHSTRFREGLNRIALIDARSGGMELLDDLSELSVGTRSADGPVWSPDGRWMAYILDGLLWAHPVGADGQATGPPRRLSNHPADAPSWTGDSRSLVYVATDRLHRVGLDGGASRELPMDLSWTRDVPDGRVVVHAGKLIDGLSPQVRENMDLVVEGNRVVSVQPHEAALHDGRVLDASGGVVMPGLIEMHAHQGESGEALGRQWLSWGITTIRDPASDAYESLERREAIESGRRLGPRIFMAGAMFDGSRIYYTFDIAMRSGAQVEAELDKAARLGYDMIKTYVRLPDALQKQVVEGAHERGIWVSSHEIYPAVSYGADGVEHLQGTSRRGYSPKISQMKRSYQDVIQLLAQSGMTMTPTIALSGAFGVLSARNPDDYFDDVRLRTFEPDSRIEGLRRRAAATARDLESAELLLANMQRTVREVVQNGGRVIAGTDSPLLPNGLALHMELEAYVDGGLTPFQALQTAGTNAASALGASSHIGHLGPGSLADLVILEASPLDDIRNTRRVLGVMKNGRYHTLEELLTAPQGQPKTHP